jgi:uncharacterized membrane protein (DUF106 family)
MNGVIEILAYTLGLSVVMAIIYRFLTNPEEMRKIKADMKDLNDRIKKAQKSNNTKEVSELTNELLKGSSRQFQSSMKPMMVSTIIFFVFLYVFLAQFEELMVMLPFSLPFLGSQLSAFYWYIVIILPASFLFRKLFGVE